MDAFATRLPGTVILVIAGLVVGSLARLAGAGPIDVSHELVLVVLLPGLVFEAAYRLDLAVLRRWSAGLTVLAVPGVIVSAGVVAFALTAIYGLPLELAFIAGAIVSATDPAAVVATFKRIRAPRDLGTIIDGESLLNDGTGLVLFAIAVASLSAPIGPVDAAVAFAASIVLSMALGLATGAIASIAVRYIDQPLVELAISIALAYGTFLLAQWLGLSGVLATVTAAVILGNFGDHVLTPDGADVIDTAWALVAFVLTAAVFVVVGVAVPADRMLGSLWPAAVAVGGTLVGRALMVYVLFGGMSRLAPLPGMVGRVPAGWLLVLFWSGLRGAVAVAATLAIPEDVPQRALIQDITFGVVLFTILVQATTIRPLVGRTLRSSATAE